MLDKTAAEKIAHEYYNAGIKLAMEQAGLIKEANQISTGRRLAGMLGLGALTPAATAAAGGGTALGKAQLEMISKLLHGEGKGALQAAKGILPGAQSDAAALMMALKGAPTQLSDAAVAAKAGIPSMFTDLMR